MSLSYLEGASFETFVEGPSNAAAAAAARAIADHPAGGPNPLVLVGPPGVGKTHLLTAIEHAALARDPELEVRLESAPGLDELMRGARGGLMPLHACDLLLLDEAETLVGHPDLEPVLLELLLGRVPFGKPVVLASAKSFQPDDASGAELAAVLAEGQVIAVAPPDAGTRLAILRRRAADLTPGLPDDVLAAVASLPLASVRELLAAIQRLVAFQSVSPVPLDAAQARYLVTGRGDPEVVEEPEPTPVALPHRPVIEVEGPPAPALALPDDEFGSFLTEVVASVSHQVDRWRTLVGDAILRYGGEGFRTRRLEALLEQEMPARPAEVVARYEADVGRLRELEAAAASLAPDLAGASVFRDPDRLEDAETALAGARLRNDPLPAPSPDLRLDRFGEGPGNRRALLAARGVAEAPGTRSNPLVIVGASGTGKTHLLHGLGNLLAGGEAIACVAALGFAGEVARLLAADGLEEWRARYRHAGALLLDDLHLLAGHPEAQQEFLAVSSHLVSAGRQVVVTANAPPASLPGIDPRLLSRLEAGLVVELPRPDREIRLLVIKQLLAGSPAAGDAALADWLAQRPAESVRAVQGAVHRVLSAAEAEGVAPSPALAREVLERGEASSRRSAGSVPSLPFRVGQGPEKMVTVWPRLSDRLIEDLD